MLTNISYSDKVKKAGRNTYFIAEGDADGHIRLENPNPANPTCNCYSVAKAFTVTAVGMLVDRGLIGTDTKIMKYFPDEMPVDNRWYDITVDHLLRHRAGLGFSLDIDCLDANEFTENYLRYLFGMPLEANPGEKYRYTDAVYYVLSRVISAVTGETLENFLRPVLMKTMKFREYAWSACPLGYTMGATGLYIRTDDLVKIGILYLRGGDWMGERIISEGWVNTVKEREYEFARIGQGDWYCKGGMRGQIIGFNPEKGLAIAWHSYDDNPIASVILAE